MRLNFLVLRGSQRNIRKVADSVFAVMLRHQLALAPEEKEGKPFKPYKED